MHWALGILAATAGYAVGSIPFAWIIARIVDRNKPLQPIRLQIPGSERELTSDAVSATAVRLQFGARYGCLTSLLDMAKAAGITLLFQRLYPGQSLHLIAAGCTVVGHIWPLFHRFRGGRGQSPIIGSLFVIDWPAALVVYPAAQLLGLVTGLRSYVGRLAPMLLLAGWFGYRFGDLDHILFAMALFVVRVVAMQDEIRQYATLRREGALSSLRDELNLLQAGESLGRFFRRFRRNRR